MFPQFQVFIRQMSLKRMNVFVHHHEDIDLKVQAQTSGLLEQRREENELLWTHLNDRVTELAHKKAMVEKLRADVAEQKAHFDLISQFCEEVLHELKEHQDLQEQLEQQHGALQEPGDFPVEHISAGEVNHVHNQGSTVVQTFLRRVPDQRTQRELRRETRNKVLQEVCDGCSGVSVDRKPHAGNIWNSKED